MDQLRVGCRRPASRRRHLMSTHQVPGYIESLEQRQMLSGTPLTFDAVADGTSNDFVLRLNGDNVELLRNNEVVRSQAAAETNAAIINAADGQADSLTIDFRNADFQLPAGISFNGGDGAGDRLVIQDSAANDSFVLTGNTISNGSTPISVENIERVLVDVSSDGPDQVRVSLPFSAAGESPLIQVIGSGDGTDTLTIDSDADNDSILTNLDGTLITVDPNSLRFVESIRDGSFQSDGQIDGLNGASSVVFSPDGNNVYVASQSSDAITVFRLDPQSGGFRFVETIVDGQTQGQNTIDGLDGAGSVAVSSDGLNVYVTGRNDDAVAVFRRDVNTGTLTFVEVQRDGQGGVTRLNGPSSVTVSPDGRNVIVAAESDSALTVFSRDAATGALTFVETLRDNRDGIDGLGGVTFVTVSPDGRTVYAAGTRDDALAVFSRDVVTGQLAFIQVLRDGTNGIDGLEEVSSVVVTADGRNVYATGSNRDESAIALFSRDVQSGELTFLGVIRNGDVQNGQTVDGLSEARSVLASEDGRFVFVVGRRDDALAVFDRDAASGQLTFREVVRDIEVEKVTNGRSTVDVLNGVQSVVVSPDGQFVLTAGRTADSLAVFRFDTESGQISFAESFVDGEQINPVEITGLDDPQSIAVSSDGINVYIASTQDNSITVFQRDAETGTLRFLQTIADEDRNNDLFGLVGARSVTISPDGANVYVASRTSDAIAVFDRDPATGFLTFLETQRNDALNGTTSVTVSLDGRSVFAVAGNADTLVVFGRDETTGRLTLQQTFQDQGVSRFSRLEGAELVEGLDSADLVTISADGRNVYVVSSTFRDNALVVFERDLTTGQLSFVEVQNNVQGLQDARSITVSSDGLNVYATGNDDDALLVFRRDRQTGSLTLVQTLTDENQGGTVDGLDGASSVTISADGNLVFVTADRDDALTIFRRDNETGELSFIQRIDDINGLDGARNAALSADGRFVYTVNGSNRTVSVFEIQQLNIAPVIDSRSNSSVAENETAIWRVTASDTNQPTQTITFSITGGDDAGFFTLDSQTGVLAFNTTPDFEAAADADGDNVYEVQVTADDGNGGTSVQTINVTVTDVNENPTITSSDSTDVAENETAVLSITASDEDRPAQALTFSITGGDDAGFFTLDSQTGDLAFNTAPDFESPGDADADNVYEVQFTIDDGNGGTAVQTIRVTVTNVNENPVITSSRSADVAENETAVLSLTATDEDLPTQTVTFSITGGDDARLFNLDPRTGDLTFNAAPDFEEPADADEDNVYEVRITADDGNGGLSSVLLEIAVSDVPDNDVCENDAPENAVREADNDAGDGATIDTVLPIFTRSSSSSFSSDTVRTSEFDDVPVSVTTNDGFRQIPIERPKTRDLSDRDFDPAPFEIHIEVDADEIDPIDQDLSDDFWRNVGRSLTTFSEALSDLGDVLPLLTKQSVEDPDGSADSNMDSDATATDSTDARAELQRPTRSGSSQPLMMISVLRNWWESMTRRIGDHYFLAAGNRMNGNVDQQASAATVTARVAASD